MTPEARLSGIIAVMLLVVGLAGLGHAVVTPSARPIQVGIGNDVWDLIRATPRALTGCSYLLYVDLAEHSEGHMLIVPGDHPRNVYNATGIGGIELITEDYDAEVAAGP